MVVPLESSYNFVASINVQFLDTNVLFRFSQLCCCRMTLCRWACSSLQQHSATSKWISPEAKAVTGLPFWHFSLQLTWHVHVGVSCQVTHRVVV